MKFIIMIKRHESFGSPERIIEADNLLVDETGTLIFYEEKEGKRQMLAYFAPDIWHSVFRMLDDGSIAMLPLEKGEK